MAKLYTLKWLRWYILSSYLQTEKENSYRKFLNKYKEKKEYILWHTVHSNVTWGQVKIPSFQNFIVKFIVYKLELPSIYF